jgi:hypothetical protein
MLPEETACFILCKIKSEGSPPPPPLRHFIPRLTQLCGGSPRSRRSGSPSSQIGLPTEPPTGPTVSIRTSASSRASLGAAAAVPAVGRRTVPVPGAADQFAISDPVAQPTISTPSDGCALRILIDRTRGGRASENLFDPSRKQSVQKAVQSVRFDFALRRSAAESGDEP